MGEVRSREATRAAGAPYPQDNAPASFAQLVDQLSGLLLRADAELSKENHDQNRVGIYMSDITSIHEDLVAQLPAAAVEFGLDDGHIKLLQSIHVGLLPAVIQKMEVHKSKLEAKKVALRRQYEAEVSAINVQLAKESPDTQPSTTPVDTNEIQPHDEAMSPSDQQILDARLETIETRMDGRVAAIELATQAAIEESRETRREIRGLKLTMIVTAIATVGSIAAFNATVLSNMVASFESGKNTATAQAEVKKQSEETAALIKRMQDDLDARKSGAPPAGK